MCRSLALSDVKVERFGGWIVVFAQWWLCSPKKITLPRSVFR
jgi:hypothetical protein